VENPLCDYLLLCIEFFILSQRFLTHYLSPYIQFDIVGFFWLQMIYRKKDQLSSILWTKDGTLKNGHDTSQRCLSRCGRSFNDTIAGAAVLIWRTLKIAWICLEFQYIQVRPTGFCKLVPTYSSLLPLRERQIFHCEWRWTSLIQLNELFMCVQFSANKY